MSAPKKTAAESQPSPKSVSKPIPAKSTQVVHPSKTRRSIAIEETPAIRTIPGLVVGPLLAGKVVGQPSLRSSPISGDRPFGDTQRFAYLPIVEPGEELALNHLCQPWTCFFKNF